MKTPLTCIAAALAISAGPFCLSPIANADDEKVHWENDVWPFIERICVDCHKAPYQEGDKIKEPKAELRFDGAWAILKGGENGPVLVAGKPDDSEMYFRVTLPEDDSDFMPSKGEVLTEKEKEILKKWIAQGADFGGWEGNLEGKPEEEPKEIEPVVNALPPSIYEILAKNVAAPAETAIKAVADSGARIERLSDAITLYRVDYFNARDDTNDDSIAVLAELNTNVAQLNLSETQITDDGLKSVAGLNNLVRLDLHQTKTGDPGLDHLLNLKNLQYLNLYETQVTDAGIQKLAKLTNLKAVYLWKTQVTESGVKKLEAALPKARINWR